MTKEEIEKKQNEDFIELLEETQKIKSKWEVYNLGQIDRKSDKNISKKLYEENFLMYSILDAFTYRSSLNLKEILEIVLSEKVSNHFFNKVPVQKVYVIIAEMIKLGYIETYQEEKTIIPIFQLKSIGIKILQERTLQNLALSSFYSYQSYNLNNKAINLSLIALLISVIAIIVSIIVS